MDTPREHFEAFHAQLEDVMRANDDQRVKTLFQDPQFGAKFYEMWVCTAAETSSADALKLFLKNMNILSPANDRCGLPCNGRTRKALIC